jgi:DNA-binding NarL/FixJ family response regulator
MDGTNTAQLEAIERSAVILDQSPLWLEAIEPLLERIGVKITGKAIRPERALALVEDTQPDAFLVELMPDGGEFDTIECIREAQLRMPNVKVIVLGMSREAESIASALEAGAFAYIVKTAHPDDIGAAVRQAFQSTIFFATGHRPARARVGGSSSEAIGILDSLTKRELEILRLVAEGHSNGQLARMLWVTEQTVKFHLSNVYRKLGVSNRTEASRWAQVHDLLAGPDEHELPPLAAAA